MLAAALPVVGDQPVLEIVKPRCGPGYECLIDPHRAGPLARSWQREAQAQGIMIDVRQGPLTRQSRKLGVRDEDAWCFAPLKCNAHGVFTAKGRRPVTIIPNKASRVQPACPRTDGIGAQKHKLLRGRQVWAVTRKHLVTEERVGANRRRIGRAGQREPDRRRDVELLGRACLRNAVGASIDNFANDRTPEASFQALADNVDALQIRKGLEVRQCLRMPLVEGGGASRLSIPALGEVLADRGFVGHHIDPPTIDDRLIDEVWHQPNGRDQNVKFGIENKALDAILIRLCRERGDDDGDRCDLLDDFQEMHITMPLEDLHRPPQDVNRRSNLTPHRRPILTPLCGGFCW